MKKILLTLAATAVVASSVSAQQKAVLSAERVSAKQASAVNKVVRTSEMMATKQVAAFKEVAKASQTDGVELNATNTPAPKKSLANGVYYQRPEGSLVNGISLASNPGYGQYYLPQLIVSPFQDIKYVNKSTNPEATTFDINTNLWTRDEHASSYDGNDFVSTYGAMGSYYIPGLNLDATRFLWGEEATRLADKTYNYTIAVTDSIGYYSVEELYSGIKMYTGFTDGYAFGTATTNFDFDKDGVAETVAQTGIYAKYPKPMSPLWFDEIIMPCISTKNDSIKFFSGDQKITLVIYGLESKKVIAKFEAGINDFLDGQIGEFTDGGAYGFISFKNIAIDEDGAEYVEEYLIDEPYELSMDGFAQEGVDFGIRMNTRPTYMTGDANFPKIYREYGENGALSWTSNAYGLPFLFHSIFEKINIEEQFESLSGIVDNNVIKVDAAGATEDAVEIETATSWYDEEYNENYYVETPEWVTEVVVFDQYYANYGVNLLTLACEPLPEGVTGRGVKVYVEAHGVKSNNAIYILQGDYTKEMVDGIKVLLGDANGDEAISVADLAVMASFILGEKVEINEKNADVNNDGEITVADLAAVANMILGAE